MTAGESFVVDTSVAIKWIIDEEGSDKAELLQGADMVTPALFRIEAGNVLRTLAAKQILANDRAIDLFLFLQTAPVTIIDADEILERRALDLALALEHPIYDCVYLALAERIDRRLITADRRFIKTLSGTEHAARVLALESLGSATPGEARL
ncbi:tRNA(fMet)-specific endonuclease VapC [Pseudooceanicola marinus]|uniref:Ribonuclease VapC n=1 Tax=Pseudooceanicola marinus TaxID=396013 RepID=A0A1X7A6E1_9RHOB|nr:type II toxin-antitoxin system VapC family toxin [Pseudooceanicola marinus]PJE33694.1 PIN domain-containing protein [Pseudooceanicola marinus]SLN71822.1 tRNA(fMet)-specific endonuclease VapC [Pseudooceanicola marinus]